MLAVQPLGEDGEHACEPATQFLGV